MEVNTISAKARTETGKRPTYALRQQGFVPAVLYGREGGAVSLAVTEPDMARELRQHHRVFNLEIGGQQQPAFLQDVQYDVVTDRPLHVDFLRVDMAEPIHVEVELTFIGIPKGQSRGGTLVRDLSRLKIVALPAVLPHEIEVKVGGVDVGDVIRAGELALPEGVSLDCPEHTVVARMPL